MTAAADTPGTDRRHDLPGDLEAALRAAAHAGIVLVALDFDGVLAPLVDDPSESRILPPSADALRRLETLPATPLALVSGRQAAELVSLADVPDGTLVVGSHGAERGRVRVNDAGERTLLAAELDLSPAQRELHAATLAAAREVADAAAGAWVEVKPASLVVHTRRCSPEDGRRVIEATLAGPAARPGLRVQRGKDVVEMAVLHATKGEGVATLREETGAEVVVFAGDDVTDEDAFAVLTASDVSIKVGSGPTAAAYRVAGPEQVGEALTRLAELRAAAGRPRSGTH